MKEPLSPVERVKLFNSVLGVGKGLDVLDEIQRFFGVDYDTFHPDPYKHAYNAGRRAAAIEIKTIVFKDLKKLEDTKQKTENVV